MAAESGIASVYCELGHTERTANGEHCQTGALTAAHNTIPFGTRVHVMNHANGRTTTVRINDRGPHVRGRIIDLTPAGAHALGFNGLAHVTIGIL